MKMIENGIVECVEQNEWGIYDVWAKYTVDNGFIYDERWDCINFGNVRKRFKLIKNDNE